MKINYLFNKVFIATVLLFIPTETVLAQNSPPQQTPNLRQALQVFVRQQISQSIAKGEYNPPVCSCMSNAMGKYAYNNPADFLALLLVSANDRSMDIDRNIPLSLIGEIFLSCHHLYRSRQNINPTRPPSLRSL